MQSQRTMAAKILKCGTSRVWMEPSRLADIEEAITSADVRRLIRDGVIVAKPKRGISGLRKNRIAAQKKKGRRRGRGSVKGSSGTRLRKKDMWVKTIRPIRAMLRQLKSEGRVDNKTYRNLYKKSKSGFFRSRGHVMIYLERNGLLKNKEES